MQKAIQKLSIKFNLVDKSHRGALLTINDRVTGLAWISLPSGKEAAPLTEAAIEALSPVKDLIHTITADNGKEFSFHERMAERLEVLVFFAKPYHSWERGANENTNGLIMQYFPKGTDFATITPEQVQWVQDKLNARPRKRLGYMSPKEKFKQLTTWITLRLHYPLESSKHKIKCNEKSYYYSCHLGCYLGMLPLVSLKII